MHVNSGYRDEAARLGAPLRRVFDAFEAVVSPSSSCVGIVRELYPELLGERPPLLDRVFELSELLVRRLGVEDVGASFPRRVTYHPTCHSLRVTRVGDAPLRLLAERARPRARRARRAPRSAAASAGRSRSRTPTRRARCSPTSARASRRRGAEVCTARRRLVPAADRRRALAAALAACAPLHLAEILAVDDDRRRFPDAARRELANAQLRANLAHATDTIRAKRARVVAELPDWEELREAGRAIKADVLAHLDELPRRSSRPRSRRPAGTCTGRATRPRRTRSSSRSRARTARPRWSR